MRHMHQLPSRRLSGSQACAVAEAEPAGADWAGLCHAGAVVQRTQGEAMKRSSHEIAAIIAAALMRGPCSLSDLCVAVGFMAQKETPQARAYVERFRAHGLVYVAGWKFGKYPMYQWQSESRRADAEKPTDYAPKVYVKKRKPKPLTVVRMPSQPASVFSMGLA